MIDPFIYGLLTISFFVFALLKSSFNSINLLQLELDQKQEHYYSRVLYWISNKKTEFTICISVYYYVNIISIVLYTVNAFNLFVNSYLFFLILIVLILPFILIVANSLGDYFANKIINFFALALVILFILIAPITYIFCILIKLTTNKSLNSKGTKESFNKEDLNNLVNEQTYQLLDNEETSEIRLFKNALQFSRIKIRECMIPRTEIAAIELSESKEELKKKFIKTGLTKIIAYKDSIDNIVGFIKSKSIFFFENTVDHSIKTLPIFPESMSASKLLRFFIATGQNMAVVVDEFGGTSGLITTEDILEEIFGEISDEHDSDNLYEKQLTQTDFIFSGRIEIDHINEKYELNIPVDDEYETLAGYILHHTEHIPNANDVIHIGHFTFKILKVSETRLELLKLEIKPHN
jgi:CBS domain containing-hemolysin-like protein